MKRRRFLATATTATTTTAGAFGSVAVAGCLEVDHDIGMTGDAFVPEEFTVEVGDQVVWYNNGTRAHTVTAYEHSIPEEAPYFASGGFSDEQTARTAWWDHRGGAIDSGNQYTYTFEIPGRYDYVCVPHEDGGMLGVIHVEG